LSYLLPIVLIGLFLFLRSMAGRSSRLRVSPPGPQLDRAPPFGNGDFGEDDEDEDEALPLETPDPIFVTAPPSTNQPGPLSGIRYLLDSGDGNRRRPDQIDAIKRTIAGKGLCSPKG
jgi:hypothetical protein